MRRAVVAALALAAAAACGGHQPVPLPDFSPGELELRRKLGIPVDAERVVVFGQSSHLDLDWQRTFDEYYDLYVEDVFLRARALLEQQPRASYSIAEIAFLEHHVAVHPEELAPLRAAAARGALRIVGGGMTSPDTLLPDTEVLARDLLYGIRWSEDELDVRPTAAWLPDSFGHGAAAPDVLAAAGYTSVGFSRIDGAPSLFDFIGDPGVLPRPGSTAAELRALGSDDFVWRGSGGATVLAHHLSGAGLYCQGDNLDYAEPFQPAGGHLGSFDDSPAFTDARVDGYAAELSPRARTRNLFVPVGCDFASPKVELIGYLDGYNRRRYPTTGVWAVAASFEDYMTLVGFHRAELPTIDHELSPYFMGFYGSRAAVKRATRDAARPFFTAEAFATLFGAQGAEMVAAGAPALSRLTWSDHHDFVTGTSTDAVVADEQLPLLADAGRVGAQVLADVADAIGRRVLRSGGIRARVLALNAASVAQTGAFELVLPMPGSFVPDWHPEVRGVAVPAEVIAAPMPGDDVVRYRVTLDVPAFGWQAIDFMPGALVAPATAVTLELLGEDGMPATGAAIARVVLASAAVRAEWARVDGRFALTALAIDGHELITAPSMTIHDYRDDGGLWRLGHEMTGCVLAAMAAPADVENVEVRERGRLAARVAFVGAGFTREVSLGAGAHALDVAVVTGAAPGTTRTVSLAVAATGALTTSVPGGAAVRPAERLFAPTFWPAVSWLRVGDVAVLLRQSTGVRMDTPGALELMAVRDARQESCEVLGGTGTDTGTHRIEWRIARASTDGEAARAAQAFDRPLPLVPTGYPGIGVTGDLPLTGTLLTIAGDGLVSALKPAERGEGSILRVIGSGATVVTPSFDVWLGISAVRVDLAERDLDRPFLVGAGRALTFDAATDGSIAGVRLPAR